MFAQHRNNAYKRVVTPATAWTKSSFCGSTTCVEVARDGEHYLLRDSKNPANTPLRFTAAEWADFLGRLRYGDLEVM